MNHLFNNKIYNYNQNQKIQKINYKYNNNQINK